MTWIMVDIDADGPIPGDYSMVQLGAVVVEPNLEKSFFERMRPISDKWSDEALKSCSLTREKTLRYADPKAAMIGFDAWLKYVSEGQPMFISDNNGFDWQFVNWHFHHFLGRNSFGHSSTNLGSLYKGMVKDMRKNFKHLRKTRHTHNPVDDAMGNAEALLEMIKLGLNFRL